MLDTGFVGQTDREKAIAEMAVIGCVRNPQAHTREECEVCDFKESMCNAYRHATKLYDYILHREEEVQKETANRFLTTLNGLLDDIEKGSIKTLEELQLQLIYNVHFLRKEFFGGVEE